MGDVVEAALDVCVQDVFGLEACFKEDRFNSVMTSASRSKSIAIGFKFGLPLWFQCLLGERLIGPVTHDGNAKRTLFRFAGFGYPYTANGLCFPLSLLLWVKLFRQSQSIYRREGGFSINACGLLALVVLGHPSHCQQPG